MLRNMYSIFLHNPLHFANEKIKYGTHFEPRIFHLHKILYMFIKKSHLLSKTILKMYLTLFIIPLKKSNHITIYIFLRIYSNTPLSLNSINLELNNLSGTFIFSNSKKSLSCVVKIICLSRVNAIFLKRSIIDRILISSSA